MGLGLVGWGWLGVGCAGKFGVGGLGLVRFVPLGLELVGWGWSVVVWAFEFEVGGLRLVGRSLR